MQTLFVYPLIPFSLQVFKFFYDRDSDLRPPSIQPRNARTHYTRSYMCFCDVLCAPH